MVAVFGRLLDDQDCTCYRMLGRNRPILPLVLSVTSALKIAASAAKLDLDLHHCLLVVCLHIPLTGQDTHLINQTSLQKS